MAKAAIIGVLEIVLAGVESVAATSAGITFATDSSNFLAAKKQ